MRKEAFFKKNLIISKMTFKRVKVKMLQLLKFKEINNFKTSSNKALLLINIETLYKK